MNLVYLDATALGLCNPAPQPKLFVRPIPISTASKYVALHHRHHDPPQGGLWACAVADKKDGRVCGVAIVGRPVARMFDDRRTIEVTRLCTDGTPNAPSGLLGAIGRYARVLGLRVVTYTLPEEGGASLRGAGWKLDGQTSTASDPQGWARQGPGRICAHPQDKSRWVLDKRVMDEPDLVWPEPPSDTSQLSLVAP